jgi:hypothetical protein
MILAILMFVEGFIFIGIAAYFMFAGAVLAEAVPFFGDLILAICMVFAVIFILIGIIHLVIGWGLMTLKSWARKIAMTLSIIGLILSILSLLGGNWPSILNLLLYFVILYYLTRPEIKAAFEPNYMPMGGPMGPPPGGPPGYGPPPGGPPGYGPPPGGPPGYGPPPGGPPGYGPPPPPPQGGYGPPPGGY